MKHFFLIPIQFISFASLYSQSANEQAVKKTLETFVLSVKNNDAAAAGNLLADSYKMDGHSGVNCITNKVQRIASIQSGRIKYDPIDFENKQNHLYIMSDTTAAFLAQQIAVTYKICEDITKNYTTRTFTLLFIKKGEHWQLSSECIGTNCVR